MGLLLRLLPLQEVQCLLSHHDLARSRREDWQQADALLLACRIGIPRQPDAVRITQLRLAMMARELLGREGVLAVRRLTLWFLCRIIVGVNDELAFHLHGLIHLVVEVQPTSKPT